MSVCLEIWRDALRRAATGVVCVLAALPGAHATAALPERVARTAAALDVPETAMSVWVAEVGAEAPLLAHLADTARMPASTMKLVTTFAALQGLGPGYRWRTETLALGEIENGTLDGDLLLRGSGDPFLVAEDYWRMIRDIRAAGVRTITGDLVLDASAFALDPEDPGAFDARPSRVYNLVPHALLVNFNAVRFTFRPQDDGPGVDVATLPELEELDLHNRLRQHSQGCWGFQRGVALNVEDGEAAPRSRVLLEGRFPSRCEAYAMTRTVLEPEAYAHALFADYFAQWGGQFDGGWRRGTLPEGLLAADASGDAPSLEDSEAFVHLHLSRPLGDLLRLVNKHSNNVMTRHLHLTLGAERFGWPATIEQGDQAVAELLQEFEVPLEGFVLGNPSGLSRQSRLSARQLGRLLDVAWQGRYMPEFVSSLPISGIDGTLRARLADSELRGWMHLKTGSMDDVSAIAGYVQARSGRRFVVAVLINHALAHRGPGAEIQEALLRWVRAQ